MFELADRLIGIYKTYNCTKSVTIDPRKISLPLGEKDFNTQNAPVSSQQTTQKASEQSQDALPGPSSAGDGPHTMEVEVGS